MDADPRAERDPQTALLLGLLVLGLTVLFSNINSIPVSPGEAIADRMARHTVARLFTVGYVAQLCAGLWLGLSLILAPRHGTRLAFAAWVLAVCLFTAPVPTLGADLALMPALIVVAAALGILVRALDRTTRVSGV